MIKSIIQYAFNSINLDLKIYRRERLESRRVLAVINELKLQNVVDIGANVGQFSTSLIGAGYRGSIISFEPLAHEHAILSRRAKKYPNWTIAERCAIGDTNGTVAINRAGNSESSSLLAMLDEHVISAPGSQYTGSEFTKIKTLDDCIEVTNNTIGSLFLKSDTQGYEIHVLRGAKNIMPRVQAMLLETSLTPLYEGCPLICEVLDYVRDLGFVVVDLVPGFYSQSGKMLQANIIVARNKALLSSTPGPA
jgi:FkbM family methyltransferase